MTAESMLEYEIERLRDRTRHNEASAIGYAKREGAVELTNQLLELGVSPDLLEKALNAVRNDKRINA
jgi:hypothetical protein